MDKTNLDINTTEFLSVDEAAKLLKTTVKSIYTYTCNSGSQNGKKRKQIPSHIYRRFGRRILFIKEKLLNWVVNEDAQMVEPGE